MSETTTSQDYITSDTLKDALGITGQVYADQAMAASITAASRMVDQLCNRFFYQDSVATTRIYTPIHTTQLALTDMVSVASVASDIDGSFTYADVWTPQVDYIIEPVNAPLTSWPYTDLYVLNQTGNYMLDPTQPQSVKIVGIWGWPAVPVAIQEATTLIAIQLLKRKREAPFGIASYDGMAMRLGQVDAQVRTLISPYRLHAVGVA